MARQAYLAEVRASTSLSPIHNEYVPDRWTDFDFYLTYLSPQLVVAAIHQEAIRRNYEEKQEKALLLDANRKLLAENSMVFVLYAKSSNTNATIDLSPFKEAATLLTVDGRTIHPSKYEPLFDQKLDLRTGTRWGYIFFPLSSGCSNGQLTNVVDLNQQPSVSVRIVNAQFSSEGFQPWFYRDMSWNYNLVPIDLSLEQALGIPEYRNPPSATGLPPTSPPPTGLPPTSPPPAGLMLGDLVNIASVILSVIQIVLGLSP